MPLFRERLKRQWHSYKKLFLSVVDITIALYVAAFGAAALYYFITETVANGQYGLIRIIPVAFYIWLALCVGSSLYIRNFHEPADRLFTMHHSHFTDVKRQSLYYSLMINSFITALLVAVTSFFTAVVHHETLWLSAALFICVYALSLSFHILALLLQRAWLLLCIRIGIAVGFTYLLLVSPLLSILVSSLVFVCAFTYYKRILIRTNRFFTPLLQQEQTFAFRWERRIFMVNPDLQQYNEAPINQKKPRVFRKRYSTTVSGALVELCFKTLWRRPSYLNTYIRFVIIVFPVLFILPTWGSYLLIIILWVGLSHFSESMITKLQQEPIFTLLHYDETMWFHALTRVRRILSVPIPIVYAVIVTIFWLIR